MPHFFPLQADAPITADELSARTHHLLCLRKIRFPDGKTLASLSPADKQLMARFANESRLVVDEQVLIALQDFMELVKEAGPAELRRLYAQIDSVTALVNRLIKKRFLAAKDRNDLLIGRDLSDHQGINPYDASRLLQQIAYKAPAVNQAITIENSICYDEALFFAFFVTVYPSLLVANIDRNNPETNPAYREPFGIFTGLVGCRFEVFNPAAHINLMESRYILVTPRQNQATNGYGDHANPDNYQTRLNQILAKLIYGGSNQNLVDYETAAADKSGRFIPYEYPSLDDDKMEVHYFDQQAFRFCMELRIKAALKANLFTLLQLSQNFDDVLQQFNKQALMNVGLSAVGTGEWLGPLKGLKEQIANILTEILTEVYLQHLLATVEQVATVRLPFFKFLDLNRLQAIIAKINMNAICQARTARLTISATQQKNVDLLTVTLKDKTINIYFGDFPIGTKLPETNAVAINFYASDSLVLSPGNEYFSPQGSRATVDAMVGCDTFGPITANAMINWRLDVRNLLVITAGEVRQWSEFVKSFVQSGPSNNNNNNNLSISGFFRTNERSTSQHPEPLNFKFYQRKIASKNSHDLLTEFVRFQFNVNTQMSTQINQKTGSLRLESNHVQSLINLKNGLRNFADKTGLKLVVGSVFKKESEVNTYSLLVTDNLLASYEFLTIVLQMDPKETLLYLQSDFSDESLFIDFMIERINDRLVGSKLTRGTPSKANSFTLTCGPISYLLEQWFSEVEKFFNADKFGAGIPYNKQKQGQFYQLTFDVHPSRTAEANAWFAESLIQMYMAFNVKSNPTYVWQGFAGKVAEEAKKPLQRPQRDNDDKCMVM